MADVQRYSMAWLKGLSSPSFLFFWGHTSKKGNQLGKECLSQWFFRPFETAGKTYATAEHWMMFEKARLFHDDAVLRMILDDENPSVAKKMGRQIQGFKNEDWNREKSRIVYEGNLQKFSQHTDLSAFLLSTEDRILVEASPDDRIWGIGLDERTASRTSPADWPGENLLGFSLMLVRDTLRCRT